MNFKFVKSATWLLLLAVGLSGPLIQAQEAPPSEYQVEAAFLFNFAKFIEWPPSAFANPNAPISIGVLGEDLPGFATELEHTVSGKRIDGRALRVVHSLSISQLRFCQIVFISPSERDDLAGILNSLKGTSVLTVSKLDRFTESGGMVDFFLDGNKVHFEINDDAARAAGLTISSKLLSLARKPERRP